MIYTATSLSLAALEMLVHFDNDLAPKDFISIAAVLPAHCAVQIMDAKSLPGDWRSVPPSPKTQALGSEWVISQKSLVMKVPSVIIPEEHIVLLNPLHPDFLKIQQEPEQPFRFDFRLVT